MSPLQLHRDCLFRALDEEAHRPRLEGHLLDEGVQPSIDVVLVDQLTDGLGDLVEQSRVPVVVWGGYRHETWAERLRRSGALAYVTVLAHPADLAIAVRRAFNGLPTFPSLSPAAVTGALTAREREVVEAYACAHPHLSRREVADLLGISENTLRVHLARARQKLELSPRTGRVQLRRALVARSLVADRDLS